MEDGKKDGARIGNGKRQKRRKKNDEKKILFLKRYLDEYRKRIILTENKIKMVK